MSGKASVVVGSVALAGVGYLLYTLAFKRLLKAYAKNNVYETEKLLNEYLMMHFGEPRELVRLLCSDEAPARDSLIFPVLCAKECGDVVSKVKVSGILRALDVGCAVGRSSFELTRYFDEVIGIDYSQSFINAANELRQSGKMEYSIAEEGDITSRHTAMIDPDIDRSKVRFFQGDACHLSKDLKDFNVVLAANLVCRLPNPILFLQRLKSLVVSGGFVVMPSPYTWLEEFTPKANWIGGYYDSNNIPVHSFDRFKEILLPDFELIKDADMPFFIRETARKNQWTVSHLTIWKKK